MPPSFALFIAACFDQTVFGSGIAPFETSGLEGVETETDVGPVGLLDYLPYCFPGWGVGGPAPVFVCDAEAFFGEKIC